jgi:hypothetical protein
MKRLVIFGVMALVAGFSLRAETWDPRAPFETPESIVPQIATADYAVISPLGYRVGLEKGKGPITVKDHAWIRAVAQQLHDTAFERTDTILGVTTNVTFYDRSGKRLHGLQVFPDRVRLDGLDYHVDAITTRTLRAMVQIQLDNDSPVPASVAAGVPR